MGRPPRHRHRTGGKGPGPGFEVNALAVEVFDPDGFKRLEGLGVTEAQVVPWYFYGGDPTALNTQIDSLARFADTILSRLDP